MQHITGIFRHQMRFSSIEDAISLDNQVLIYSDSGTQKLRKTRENQFNTTPKKRGL
jgi:hypothetical protein